MAGRLARGGGGGGGGEGVGEPPTRKLDGEKRAGTLSGKAGITWTKGGYIGCDFFVELIKSKKKDQEKKKKKKDL